jgi:hypothetical protein
MAGPIPSYGNSYNARTNNAVNGNLEKYQNATLGSTTRTALSGCFSVQPPQFNKRQAKQDDSGYYEALGLNEYG